MQAIVEMTSWSQWRKDQLVRAIEVLVETQLLVDLGKNMPDDRAFRKRFAAAMKLFANC
jgi:hypothetical protein